MVGDASWLTAMLIYLPRHVLLVPALMLAVMLRSRRRLALGYGIVSCAVILPFAGFHVALPSSAARGTAVRVLSYNVWYGYGDNQAIQREIEDAAADIVLVQALSPGMETYLDWLFQQGGWHTHSNVEFYLASKYPILQVVEAPVPDPRLRPPYTRYTLDTTIGRLDVFNVHLLSPRAALASLRGSKRHLLSRMPGNPRAEIVVNSEVRANQTRDLGEAVARAEHAAIVAGDLNLPEQSAVFDRYLGELHDGFAEVGVGLGYTYPANIAVPWMRIDRILCSDALAFVNFAVGGGSGSDHHAIRADIARRESD
jgi:endonuclease/exonuclease/phosphatase family metal-dependent hydrolase